MKQPDTRAIITSLLLALTFAATGLRPASANDEFLTHLAKEQTFLVKEARDVEVFVRLTAAQVARLRTIAEGTKPKRRTILRMGEGSEWHRFWASFYTREEDSDADMIELSVRKSRLLWLPDLRIDFRISPLTATATASAHYYSTSCPRYSCEERSYPIENMDMRTAEIREWFREELDFWMAAKL